MVMINVKNRNYVATNVTALRLIQVPINKCVYIIALDPKH